MPWWCKSLWALRHNLRNAYKLKCHPNATVEALSAYNLLKANYQKALRKKRKKAGKYAVIII
jgi:hypothetical protein